MESLRRRIRTATDAARGREKKRVTCIQWTEPVYAAGAWVPELIQLAGGEDTTCTAGGPSVTLSQAQVRFAARLDRLFRMWNQNAKTTLGLHSEQRNSWLSRCAEWWL
jgi:hypothetical protein